MHFRLCRFSFGCHFRLIRCCVTWLWMGMGVVGVVVPLTSRPLGRRGSTLAQVHPFSRGFGRLYFRGGRFACGSAFVTPFRPSLCKSCPRFFSYDATTVFRRVTAPWSWALTRVVRSPHAVHRGACAKLRCVWSKRWESLHWKEPFGATYAPWPLSRRARWEIAPWTPPNRG
jgi:hypothetical protein